MREYSVRITLSGRNQVDVKKQLCAAFGASVVRQSTVAGVDELPNYHDSCQANDHFGCVHWTDEDLVSRLAELNFEATPEILDSIKSSYAIRHISDRMIERGWDVIEQAILDTNPA